VGGGFWGDVWRRARAAGFAVINSLIHSLFDRPQRLYHRSDPNQEFDLTPIILILPIGNWVLETACKTLRSWQRTELTCNLTLSINVSASQFLQSNFVSHIEALVRDYGICADRLKLELTESLLLMDVEDTIKKIGALNTIGIRLELDDFGTGYSSLQYLKRLPLDQIKIDQSFLRDIETDADDRAIVTTIINMSKSLNVGVIAEGVETNVQRQFLIDHGCKHFQGYMFGKPVPEEQFIETLKD